MSQFPTGTATRAPIIETLKALAGYPPKRRASFAKGRCVHDTYIASARAAENYDIPELHKTACWRFSVGSGTPNMVDRARILGPDGKLDTENQPSFNGADEVIE